MAAQGVCRRSFALLVVLAAFWTPGAWAQSGGEADFYRAYYLEHGKGDLEAAHALYEEVAASRRAGEDIRAEARRLADSLAEDIVASDFARLMPRDAILYAELSRPGAQLSMLLDQLGLLGRVGERGPDSFGVSPLLVEGLLGMRGAAVAITEIDPTGGPPGGVLVLHPGKLDVIRGMIETALPAGGRAADPIAGHPTWILQDAVSVTLTSRLVVVSPDPRQIEAVLQRLRGERGDSLADNQALRSVLESRGEGLLTFCVNAEPVLPMIRQMAAQAAQNDPEAAMALAFLDIESLRSLSGHVGVDDEGIAIELALELAEGHRNLAFNLMRSPHVERATLESIPAGSACFLATAFNPEAGVAPILRDSTGQPVVTLMDFGRELFGNLIDLSIYALPPDGGGPSPIPDVAAVLRVNDTERSAALWGFALGLGGAASGSGSIEPDTARIAGVDADVFRLGGVPVYVAAHGDRLVVSPSKRAVERALQAGSGRSVLDDPTFAAGLERIGEGRTFVAMANAGRCIELAGAFQPPGQAGAMAPFAELFGQTVVSVGCEHTETRWGFQARVSRIPDISGLVAGAMRGAGAGLLAAAPAPTKKPVEASARTSERDHELAALREELEILATVRGDHRSGNAVGERIFEVAFDDAKALDNLAWTLASQEPFAGNYTELALRMAERANDLTDFAHGSYLDTLALVMFQMGEVREAVRLQTQAVELAGDGPGREEAQRALERYRSAGDPVAAVTGGG